MSTHDNKALAQRWLEEVWNKGDLNLIDELIAPEYVLHDPTRPGLRGRAGIRESVALYRRAFPDLFFTIEDQVTETDKIVTRWTAQGTHLGPLMGIPATGKQGRISGIDIYRITDGQIAEAWSNWDTLGLLQLLQHSSQRLNLMTRSDVFIRERSFSQKAEPDRDCLILSLSFPFPSPTLVIKWCRSR